MRRLLIVLAVLVACCMAPNAAYAQEVSLVDSFTNGVGTWGGGQKEEMDSDSSEKGIESGGLLAAPAEGNESASSTVEHVNSTLDSFNTVVWGTGSRDLLGSVQVMFGTLSANGYWANLLILPAIAMVFLWWGVRKGLRILMSAWRRGRASV